MHGTYLLNQTKIHYGFSVEETKEVLVVNVTSITHYNFDCNGEGSSGQENKSNKYQVQKKLTEDTWAMLDLLTKQEEISFIKAPKQGQLIFAPREDNKVDGELFARYHLGKSS